jgi:hypothetical protein
VPPTISLYSVLKGFHASCLPRIQTGLGICPCSDLQGDRFRYLRCHGQRQTRIPLQGNVRAKRRQVVLGSCASQIEAWTTASGWRITWDPSSLPRCVCRGSACHVRVRVAEDSRRSLCGRGIVFEMLDPVDVMRWMTFHGVRHYAGVEIQPPRPKWVVIVDTPAHYSLIPTLFSTTFADLCNGVNVCATKALYPYHIKVTVMLSQ